MGARGRGATLRAGSTSVNPRVTEVAYDSLDRFRAEGGRVVNNFRVSGGLEIVNGVPEVTATVRTAQGTLRLVGINNIRNWMANTTRAAQSGTMPVNRGTNTTGTGRGPLIGFNLGAQAGRTGAGARPQGSGVRVGKLRNFMTQLNRFAADVQRRVANTQGRVLSVNFGSPPTANI